MNHAGVAGPSTRARPAVRAGHDESHLLRRPAQRVGERRAFGGVLRRVEGLRHVRDVFPVEHQRRARHVEQVRGLGRHRRRPLRDRRRVVENPDAAAVRAEHEILRARMHEDVVVARRRQIRGEARPVGAAVVRHEQRAFGAREEHVRIAREFGQTSDRRVVGRQARRHGLPRLAEVGRAEDVRREVAVAVRVERDVRRAARRRRGDDRRRRTCRPSRR